MQLNRRKAIFGGAALAATVTATAPALATENVHSIRELAGWWAHERKAIMNGASWVHVRRMAEAYFDGLPAVIYNERAGVKHRIVLDRSDDPSSAYSLTIDGLPPSEWSKRLRT